MIDYDIGHPGYISSLRSSRRLGFALIAFVAGSFGVWSGTAPLSSAVVASGQFEVDGNIKKVQHQAGGVVSEILAHEGQRVGAGEVLVRLDGTSVKSNVRIVNDQLDQLWMSVGMLEAEIAGASSFPLPAYFAARDGDPDVMHLYQGELARLGVQRAARLGQQDQLRQQITQLGSQIEGLEQQLSAKRAEREVVKVELVGLNNLLAKSLVPVSQVNDLKRQETVLDGDIGQVASSIADLKGKRAEKDLQILNIDQQASADASNNLRDARNKISELAQKQIDAEDQLTRLDVRSPIPGIVHELSVHTVGGVVAPGETLMMIVPDRADLNIQVAISPRDIESVHLGDSATIRVVGLNRSTTPELDAAVELVGADLVQDSQSHATYYPVRLRLKPGEVGRLEGAALLPGMPVDVFITTSQRTFFDYLAEPFLDRLSRAIREK